MNTQNSEDVRDLRWIEQSWAPEPTTIGAFMPKVFPAYARVLHYSPAAPPDKGTPTTWSALAEHAGIAVTARISWDAVASAGFQNQLGGDSAPSPGRVPLDQLELLVSTLASHTRTGDDCYFAVWQGWFGLDEGLRAGTPLIEWPYRTFIQVRGPITTALQELSAKPYSVEHRWLRLSPSMWWPADHSWFVITEIDSTSTFIGGSRACISELVDHVDLDAIAVEHNDLPGGADRLPWP